MAYDSTKQYIDNDDYRNFAGIDLQFEMKDSATDDPTRKVDLFLKNTQTWFYQHIQTHFEISSWDDDTFIEALLWQVKHILKYGEDEEIDDTAYNIMHESGMINPQVEARYYRRW